MLHSAPWVRLTLALGLFVALPARSDDRAELARYDAKITEDDRAHWAFQPIGRPPIPEVKDTSWVRNPIDRFVLAKLEEKGWRPSPAPPRALLRRVYLDIIGLPPTVAEQDAFLANSSPEAFRRVVDDLLARPAYGERWARHWLDLVRYAESNGYERDATKPNAWKYRDYVIRSLNEDKPYDCFILEQVAGDELPDADANTRIATGFYRLGPWDDEPADPEQDRFDQLDDLVTTTGEVFLGLTVGCARCHDHKFEPITMRDYYRMVALFDPLRRPQLGRTELGVPVGTHTELEKLAVRDRRIKDLDDRIADQRWREITLAGFLAPDRMADLKAAGARIREDIDREKHELRRAVPDLPLGYALDEPSPKAPRTHLLLRGRATAPGPKVEPGVPAVLVAAQPTFLPPDERTTRRRLTLARWLIDRKNPLVARVIVNRVWQFHFGEGLVRTPSDFGTAGDPPTHPELLDWLADWFVQEGWSLKRLHRLILDSQAYRMAARWNDTYGAEDPDSRLLWRKPYRRLEVEVIRDSMLAVSGMLNPAMYGPSMYPEIPQEAIEAHTDKEKAWRPFDERGASRRTVYAFVKRSLVVPMLDVLDFCDTARSSARRNVTSIAPQALTLLNGSFLNRQAEAFASRLEREAGSEPGRQLERAFLLALCRPPKESERSALLRFLTDEARNQAERGEDTAQHKALVQTCRAILNLNEFVYPD